MKKSVSYTHLDVYKRQDLPCDESIQVFGTETSRVLIGDLENVEKYLETYQMCIRDSKRTGTNAY